MKIVNLKEFRKLPPNTLFAKYEPCSFQDMLIKGETWDVDFLYQDIQGAIKCSGSDEFVAILEDSKQNGTSFSMDFDCQGRDGFFDDSQLFCVWEKEDVIALIARLQECVL